MDAFITKIAIQDLLNLHNLNIELSDKEKQHLLLTGKNGSGKTTLLRAISKYLSAINDGHLNDLKERYPHWISDAKRALDASDDSNRASRQKDYVQAVSFLKNYSDGIVLDFYNENALDTMYAEGDFFVSFYQANRKTNMEMPTGVEKIILKENYSISENASTKLIKYMVHLKTQQSYAMIEKEIKVSEEIEQWFVRFENFLRLLFDNETLKLRFDFKRYAFTIEEDGKIPYGFNELSDGYSAVLDILADLLLRMDQNWFETGTGLCNYNKCGIVLIDEIETHLHVELQRKILPALTTIFPNVQFIVTTHSPYVLTSVENAVAFDLENKNKIENLWLYTADQVAEAYFNIEQFSDRLQEEVNRYQYLKSKDTLSDEERAERAELRIKFKNIMHNSFLTGIIEDIDYGKDN